MDEELDYRRKPLGKIVSSQCHLCLVGPVRQGYGLQPPHATFRSGKLSHYHHPVTSLKTEMLTKVFGGGDSYYAGAASPKEMIGQKGGYGEAQMPAMENTVTTGMLQNPQEHSSLKWLEKETVSKPEIGVEKQTKITQQMGAIEKEEKIGVPDAQSANGQQEFTPIEKDRSHSSESEHLHSNAQQYGKGKLF